MRLVVFLGCIVLTATGCRGVGFSRYSSVACPKPGDAAPNGPGTYPGSGAPNDGSSGALWNKGGSNSQTSQGCPPGFSTGYQPGYQDGFQQGYRQACQSGNQQGCPAPCRDAKTPTIRELRGPEPESVAAKPSAAAVAPDILLIPKTVLVPYAAHVPTGPMRMAGMASAPICQAEERASAPAPVASSTDSRVLDALDQSLQQMKLLNQRIAELETRAVKQIPCPPPANVRPYCPPAHGAPFLNPGVEYPPPGYSPLLPPRTLPLPSVPMVPPPPAPTPSGN